MYYVTYIKFGQTMKVNISLVKTIDNSYDITIDTIPTTYFDTKVAIVTNPKVAGLHLAYLLFYYLYL